MDKYDYLLAQRLIGAFAKRGFEGFYCETSAEALDLMLGWVPEGSTVSSGGSLTLKQIGLIDALSTDSYRFLDPYADQSMAQRDEICHQAMNADYYFLSANAIAATGEIVNVDGYGNRVASLIFGPKHVALAAGMNKVVPDLQAALTRAQTTAPAKLALLYSDKYPTLDDVEKTAAGMYSQTVITTKSMNPGRVKIVLVGESLGL